MATIQAMASVTASTMKTSMKASMQQYREKRAELQGNVDWCVPRRARFPADRTFAPHALLGSVFRPRPSRAASRQSVRSRLSTPRQVGLLLPAAEPEAR